MQANYSNSPYTFALFLLGILLPQVLQYDSLESGFPVSRAEPEIASNEVGQPKFVQQDFVSKKDRLAYSEHWVCKLSPDVRPNEIAEELGAKFLRRLTGLTSYAIFEIPKSRNRNRVGRLMKSIPGILWYEQQVLRERVSKNHSEPPSFTDPLFSSQWHLYSDHLDSNTGSSQVDLNLTSLWAEDYLGQGIQIAVVDDGIEYTHPDLSSNYSASLSYDFQDQDSDPAPVFSTQFHGTAVGGLIGARDNGKYGVGIAPRATLAGYRILGGSISDYQEAEAMALNNDQIHIYNNSWGPSDTDSRYYSGAGPLYLEALQNSVQTGRQGLGNIYVWAGGNGGETQDNSNYDGYANLPWTIAVTGINEDGTKPSYSEPGANLFISAPGINIWTTDLMGLRGDSLRDYLSDFGGTSAATGMISGAIALILQKNPHLSWRDVQHVLALSARQNDPSHSGWQINGVGIPVHHNYGFGLIDTSEAANLADNWISMPDSSQVTLHQNVNQTLQNLPDATLHSQILSTHADLVEHVQVTLTLQNYDWGELNVSLTSPDGTESILAQPYGSGLGPESNSATTSWTYMTVRNWAESANGIWTLSIQNKSPGHAGRVVSWDLTLHTTTDPNQQLPTSLEPNGEIWETSNLSGTIQSINVLQNDANNDWSLLRISNPIHGSASFSPEGVISYQPNLNFTGLDKINYTVTDSDGREGRAQLQIHVVTNQSSTPETVLAAGGAEVSFNLSPSNGQHYLISQPDGGTAEIINGNTLVYQAGSGSFSETVLHTQYTSDSTTFTTQTFVVLNSPTGELSRSLNGASDRLELLPAGLSNTLSTPFTLEAWIHPSTYGSYESGGLPMGYARIFEKEVMTLFLCNESPVTPSGANYYQDRSLALWYQTQSGDIRYISTPSSRIELDTWQHVAVTVSTEGAVQLYINGELQPLYSPSISGDEGPVASNSQYQMLFGNNSSGERGFNGKVDHLRYWSLQRTSDQIAQSYQFPVSGDESGLTYFWSLDNSSHPATSSSKHRTPDYIGTTSTSPYLWQTLYLPDATPIAPDWWESASMGLFNTTQAPWLWSPDHNFLYLSASSAEVQQLWFFDSQLEWIWTELSSYPWIWSNRLQTWLYYQSNSHNPRSFFDDSSQNWTTDVDLSTQSPKF